MNDEKEIKPLKEVVESLSSSSTAQLSSKEIDLSLIHILSADTSSASHARYPSR